MWFFQWRYQKYSVQQFLHPERELRRTWNYLLFQSYFVSGHLLLVQDVEIQREMNKRSHSKRMCLDLRIYNLSIISHALEEIHDWNYRTSLTRNIMIFCSTYSHSWRNYPFLINHLIWMSIVSFLNSLNFYKVSRRAAALLVLLRLYLQNKLLLCSLYTR